MANKAYMLNPMCHSEAWSSAGVISRQYWPAMISEGIFAPISRGMS